jgi:polyferredoxin
MTKPMFTAKKRRGGLAVPARVLVSALVFTLFASLFMLPGSSALRLSAILPKLQLFPALLRVFSESGGLAVPAVLEAATLCLAFFILTLVFGRIYCSFLCPLGALQDLLLFLRRNLSRLARQSLVRRAAGRAHASLIRVDAKTYFKYHPGRPLHHAAVFVLALAAALAGASALLGLLEPFSTFGKIAAGLLRPLADLVNNAAAALSRTWGSYDLSFVSLVWEMGSGPVGAGILLAVGILSLARGRLFCNLLCPTGALLRFMSRKPLFGLEIEKASCTGCGACSGICRSSCVKPKGEGIEQDRCVRCFDCVKVCPTGAISLRRFPPGTVLGQTGTVLGQAKPPDQAGTVLDRGGFLRFGAVAIGSAAFVASGGTGIALGSLAQTRKSSVFMEGRARLPAAPPGAGDVARFLGACTSCGTCVSVCPSGVLKPSAFDWGLLDEAKPYLAYDRAYCQFECDLCLRACPTGALRQIPLEE